MIKCYLFARGYNGEHYEGDSSLCLAITLPGILPIDSIIHLNDEQQEEWDKIYDDGNEGSEYKYDGSLTVRQIFFTMIDNGEQAVVLSCDV